MIACRFIEAADPKRSPIAHAEQARGNPQAIFISFNAAIQDGIHPHIPSSRQRVTLRRVQSSYRRNRTHGKLHLRELRNQRVGDAKLQRLISRLTIHRDKRKYGDGVHWGEAFFALGAMREVEERNPRNSQHQS